VANPQQFDPLAFDAVEDQIGRIFPEIQSANAGLRLILSHPSDFRNLSNEAHGLLERLSPSFSHRPRGFGVEVFGAVHHIRDEPRCCEPLHTEVSALRRAARCLPRSKAASRSRDFSGLGGPDSSASATQRACRAVTRASSPSKDFLRRNRISWFRLRKEFSAAAAARWYRRRSFSGGNDLEQVGGI